MKFGVGQRASRVEDRRLLRGQGAYTDDHNLPGQLHAVILHSPLAAARIAAIDIEPAVKMPGVQAIFTGADVAADGLGSLPCIAGRLLPLNRPDGQPMYEPPRPLLVRDQVRFVGDYVAMVIADSVAEARDAVEMIAVDYDELPALIRTDHAIDAHAPTVWPDCAGNVAFEIAMGDHEKVAAAIAGADHLVRQQIRVSRIAQNPMEPRAALGQYDPGLDRYTLISGTQNPHDMRQMLADEVLRIPETSLRVVSPDMGGAFGMRSNVFPELALVLWAARKTGRPVKWTGDRSEAFLTDDHGRDMVMEVELALSRDGDFQALRLTNVANMGAYLSVFGPFPAFGNMGGLAGTYRTPAIAVKVKGVFSHTTPIGPYRGAGRPEAIMAIETTIDQAARALGFERTELRRRNMIGAAEMPFQTGLTYLYDCGDFQQNFDTVAETGDVDGFAGRRAQSEAAGKLRGLGLINSIEQSAGLFDEGAEIRFDGKGHATLAVGTHSHGQGHETVFRQLLAEKLGLDFEAIHFVQGDTDKVHHGHGTFGSRSAVLGGGAIYRCADLIIEQGRKIAAHHLETAEDDIEFAAGAFSVAGTDRHLALAEVAALALNPAARPADMDAGLRATASFTPSAPTFPNASHAVEVEIDPDTGTIDIARYSVACDVGRVLNPLLLEGQVHGGIVQGIGQILCEDMHFDTDTGQPVTGSFMDYAMPRADQVPSFAVRTQEVLTARNPLGVKGAGEAGTVGAMPALSNAIADALASAGARMPPMPATPETIWRALQNREAAP